MPLANESILHVWQLGITGKVATMSANLDRYADAATRADASEAVTIVEIGTSGQYAITYTPTLSETYACIITESTLGVTFRFEDVVSSAPSAATVSDAYCSVADVVAFAQIGTPSATSTPTESQVLGFMAKRASQVYAKLASVLGTSAPGPSNYDVTIDTTADKGRSLDQACRLANALGAAMDQLEAAGAGEAPGRSERVNELGAAFAGSLEMLVEPGGPGMAYRGYGGLAKTHLSDGSITRGSTTSREQQGLVVDDTTRF